MTYFEIKFSGNFDKDLLSGILWQLPIDSIVTEDDALKVYISQEGLNPFIKSELNSLSKQFEANIEFIEIPHQNWNEKWELHFQPVNINQFCHIRADFHHPSKNFKHEIIINPKMAFGTAHHETTFMMIEFISEMELKDKSVFDYGTGTGILAILAEKMGAKNIYAIDIDENSLINAKENAEINGCNKMEVFQIEINKTPLVKFDLILANINVNVLRVEDKNILNRLVRGGELLLSGIMIKHHEEIISQYSGLGLKFVDKKVKGDWTCLKFRNP